MAHLTLMLDNREVRKFVLNSGVTSIGRGQDNDIVINNLALSRRHAQLEMDPDGGFSVIDLGSQNGVYVNSDRIRESRSLDDRDTITLGTYNFVFNEDAQNGESRRRKKKRRPPPPRRPSSTQAEEAPAADAEPTPLLVMRYNDVELQRFAIKSDSSLIGRAKDCTVQIPERRLSRKHCQIVRNEGDRYFVKDLGSQNGTYVNRRRIRGFHELTHGDVLNFAEYSITFYADVRSYHGDDDDDGHEEQYDDERYDSDVSDPEDSIVPSTDPDEVAGGETVMPPAYTDDYGYQDSGHDYVQPSDYDEDDEGSKTPAPPVSLPAAKRKKASRELPKAALGDELGEPIIERPRDAQARRGRPERKIRETRRPDIVRRAERRPRSGERPAPKPARSKRPDKRPAHSDRPEIRRSKRPVKTAKPEPKKKRPTRRLHEPAREEPMYEDEHDPELDDWYAEREASNLYDPIEKSEVPEDEDSVLLPREASSVPQVLSTMMLNKRELDRNLKKKRRGKGKRFEAHVVHDDETLFSGPLEGPVTILGTDRDADIQLKGRYVAGRHSLLVQVRDSLLLVRLGSSSAARVNGLPKLQAFLKPGDVIQIDETTIEINVV